MPATTRRGSKRKRSEEEKEVEEGEAPSIKDVLESIKKLDKNIKELDEKFDHLDKKFDKKLDRLDKKVDALVVHSPMVAISIIRPDIDAYTLTVVDDAVRFGGQSTWTYLRTTELEDKNCTCVAVGSVHCGLYYETVAKGKLFVNLPKHLVDAKVLRIGLLEPDQLKNPIPVKNDVMCVQLGIEDTTPLFPSGTTTGKYNVYKPYDGRPVPQVAGRSHSGIVSGSYCSSYDPECKEGLVFVENAGEPGNSGTLMFGWDEKVEDAKALGVYYGVDHTIVSPLRPRGRIGTLPVLTAFTWFDVCQDPLPHTLEVVGKEKRKCRVTGNGASCTLKDDGDWPGVLIETGDVNIAYCGAKDVGSCRTKG